MSNFDEQLARMKGLMNYGKVNEEASPRNNSTLEFHKVAADGKTYGIIRECNKYYIKKAENGKELMAEGYNYIGGFNNKKDYEYFSYANALKQFELKLASINEACEGKVNVETLDPFRSNAVLAEGTDKMRDEIARQRQIMYNAAMLMNEEAIGAARKNDVVMYDGKEPEAENGKKGDEVFSKKAEAKLDKDMKEKANGVDKKATPFEEQPKAGKDQLKEEECCGGECEKDWGSEGIGKGRDPKQIGWDIEGQHEVNEEEGQDMFNDGLPKEAGIGDAREHEDWVEGSKTVEEGCEEACCEDKFEDDEELRERLEAIAAEFPGFDVEAAMDAQHQAEMDMQDEEEPMCEDFEFGEEDDDEEEGEEEPEDDEIEFGEEEPADDEAEFGDEEEPEDGEMELGDEDVDEEDPEAIRNEIDRLLDKLAEIEDAEDEDEPEDDLEEPVDDEMGDEDFSGNEEGMEDAEEEPEEEPAEEEPEAEDEEDEVDECGNMPMMEAKKNYMNSIVESVVREMLSEDELHDFGKHPGYRKKPMELPETGEDKNEHGEDWNDESVHSEEPFGSKIGSSDPFEQIVNKVAEKVMESLKKK